MNINMIMNNNELVTYPFPNYVNVQIMLIAFISLMLATLLIYIIHIIYRSDRPSTPGDRPSTPENRPNTPEVRPGTPVNRPSTPEDRPNQWVGQNVLEWLRSNNRILGSVRRRRYMPIYNALTRRDVFDHEPGYSFLANPTSVGLEHHPRGNVNLRAVNRFIDLYQYNRDPNVRALTHFTFLGIVHRVRTEHLHAFHEADLYLQACLVQALIQYGDIPTVNAVPNHIVGVGILNTWYRNFHEPTTNGYH